MREAGLIARRSILLRLPPSRDTDGGTGTSSGSVTFGAPQPQGQAKVQILHNAPTAASSSLWGVPVRGVVLDGRSIATPGAGGGVTAIVDSGNPGVTLPAPLADEVNRLLGAGAGEGEGLVPCPSSSSSPSSPTTPSAHVLDIDIDGVIYRISGADLIGLPAEAEGVFGEAGMCRSLVGGPSLGGSEWSLGEPFLWSTEGMWLDFEGGRVGLVGGVVRNGGGGGGGMVGSGGVVVRGRLVDGGSLGLVAGMVALVLGLEGWRGLLLFWW